MPLVNASKENALPDESFFRRDSCRPTKKVMYRCLGIAAFVAACVPANIVAWIYLFEAKDKNDPFMPLININNTTGDKDREDEHLSNLTSQVIFFSYVINVMFLLMI